MTMGSQDTKKQQNRIDRFLEEKGKTGSGIA